jgi:hypothetical protein
MDEQKKVPTYGLLMINHAYSEGKITYKQWVELSRAWALKMKEQYQKAEVTPDSHSSRSA